MKQDKFAKQLSSSIPKLTSRYIAYVLEKRSVERIDSIVANDHYEVKTDKGVFRFENLGLDIGYTNELK